MPDSPEPLSSYKCNCELVSQTLSCICTKLDGLDEGPVQKGVEKKIAFFYHLGALRWKKTCFRSLLIRLGWNQVGSWARDTSCRFTKGVWWKAVTSGAQIWATTLILSSKFHIYPTEALHTASTHVSNPIGSLSPVTEFIALSDVHFAI